MSHIAFRSYTFVLIANVRPCLHVLAETPSILKFWDELLDCSFFVVIALLHWTMLPRRIPFHQLVFAAILGVCGGIYIYKPMFEPLKKTASKPEEGLLLETAEPKAAENSPQATLEGSAVED
ncbi:hypothetical protein DNTS_033343 [Danionella cerebrum]|uniref:Uncharacterized protein n=1 Tax=Danionella cerebrum TaxID=2873325 RepID=A0A553QJP1_9TELE|nr:hypothetical protein DNTS_033343 [Danionella translucida]